LEATLALTIRFGWHIGASDYNGKIKAEDLENFWKGDPPHR